ncbi:MAG: hypothetical protein FWG77_04090 [Treponema sp.]|nr:hypothetical protein [Treponema sp.]
MKRKIIAIILVLCGMTVFAQGRDMSYFYEELTRSPATFLHRLETLEAVRDANITGIGDFYLDALRFMITQLPNIHSLEDRENVEAALTILARGLAAEVHTAAAPELWQIVQFADVVHSHNEGHLMQEALLALGQVGDPTYVQHIALRLDNFNTDIITDVETRRRVQRAVVGCINALETLGDAAGYRSVFFASMGWYDGSIRTMARNALPTLLDDPADIIIEIIRDGSIVPAIKYEAFRAMLETNAPGESKARVAATALNTGWTQLATDPNNQRIMREMRMAAIDTIRDFGATEDSVYVNLRRSYDNNYVSVAPDYDEIRRTIGALSALADDQAVNILLDALRELNTRRRLGPWRTNRERQIFGWVLVAVGATGTSNLEMRTLLTTISRSDEYTGIEQGWARDALNRLGN